MKFNFVKQSLLAASIITFIVNIIGALLGFFREAAIANYFGTSIMLDIFILAFTIPDFITSVIVSSLPTALIPSLKKIAPGDSNDEPTLFWSGFIVFFFIFLILSLVIYLLRNYLMIWLGPELSLNELATGNRMLTILAFYVFFRGLEFYFRGWLFEKKHFIIPSSMGIILNIVTLFILLVFYNRFNIEALAYGWLISAIVLFALNGITALWIMKPKFIINIHSPWIKFLLQSTIMISIIESISLIYPVIDRYFASKYLDPGYISALRYATALIFVPNRLFAVVLSSASFPFIADLFKSGNLDKLKQMYNKIIGLMLFVMGFIAIFIIVFSHDIIYITLQRGAFGQLSADLTIGPLIIYSSGIVLSSIYVFQMRFYYAKSNYRRLVLIRFIMFMIKLLLSILLVFNYKHNGLALATICAWAVGFILMNHDLCKLLKIDIKDMYFHKLSKNILHILIVGLFFTATNYFWGESRSLFLIVSKLSIIGVGGAIIYYYIASLIKLPEANIIKSIITKRIFNR